MFAWQDPNHLHPFAVAFIRFRARPEESRPAVAQWVERIARAMGGDAACPVDSKVGRFNLIISLLGEPIHPCWELV
jgi:hypothetical protein